ncbi:MAG: helix-turn-helix domain-containing protein [Clostridiales bacterium]|nr:helix-turn-helix domain-containing protein [Clostridiales bacterium]
MKFRELRKSKNITQTELANAIGVRQSAVSNWESGRSKPMTDSIIKIASVLNCSMQTVFECFVQ